MAKVAVILSGCGVYDGTEINEAVLALYALERSGASYQCFALNKPQHHVVNHLSGNAADEQTRNVLEESARIVRGNVKPLTDLDAESFDAILVPGGFGVAKNLCDFAEQGSACTVEPTMLAVGQAFAQAGKPAGYMCIAPVLLPTIYGEGVIGTIGHDPEVAGAFTAMGGEHQDRGVSEIATDEDRKVVTTPAYMLAKNIAEAAKGIDKLVEQLLDWC